MRYFNSYSELAVMNENKSLPYVNGELNSISQKINNPKACLSCKRILITSNGVLCLKRFTFTVIRGNALTVPTNKTPFRIKNVRMLKIDNTYVM